MVSFLFGAKQFHELISGSVFATLYCVSAQGRGSSCMMSHGKPFKTFVCLLQTRPSCQDSLEGHIHLLPTAIFNCLVQSLPTFQAYDLYNFSDLYAC